MTGKRKQGRQRAARRIKKQGLYSDRVINLFYMYLWWAVYQLGLKFHMLNRGFQKKILMDFVKKKKKKNLKLMHKQMNDKSKKAKLKKQYKEGKQMW